VLFAKKMDCRVKPGNDNGGRRLVASLPENGAIMVPTASERDRA
jgi:hypothetical protein